MDNKFRIKGKFQNIKKIESKMKSMENLWKGRRPKVTDNPGVNSDEDNVYLGTRIVNLKEFGKNLKCLKCKKVLSMEKTVKETRVGLHSILEIVCECSNRTQVSTGKIHRTRNNENHSDVNTKVVVGAVHSGIGCTALNKLLACLNIPQISSSLYKRYEREIGPVVEEVAKESCKRAAQEERQLVMEQMDKLCKELPEEIFNEIYPHVTTLHCTLNTDLYHGISTEDAMNNNTEEKRNDNTHEFDTAFLDIVHLIVSYDMGWSKRGTGRSYDSLNGYGAIIGCLTGKVLDFATRNRKCMKCDKGHTKDDHDVFPLHFSYMLVIFKPCITFSQDLYYT